MNQSTVCIDPCDLDFQVLGPSQINDALYHHCLCVYRCPTRSRTRHKWRWQTLRPFSRSRMHHNNSQMPHVLYHHCFCANRCRIQSRTRHKWRWHSLTPSLKAHAYTSTASANIDLCSSPCNAVLCHWCLSIDRCPIQ